MTKPAAILVFDSGVGGLTVFREIKAALPGARYIYVADDAGFPYGDQPEDALITRILSVVGTAIAQHEPDLVVIACNTASTLALTQLRAKFSVPFVGTVPAIKPACAQSKARRIAVLGTQATVSREYTKALIREFSAGCDVGLVGSSHLAMHAESELAGQPAADEAIKAEIAPCFVDAGGRRTDTVVLACTHYPLLTHRFKKRRTMAGRVARSSTRHRAARRRPYRRARGQRNTARATHGLHLRPGAAAAPRLGTQELRLLAATNDRPQLQRAAIDHIARHVDDNGEADIGDPAMLLQQAGDKARGDTHQHDRQAKTEDQRGGMVARSARHREYVIE